ncbi:hypothetical protein [Methanosphaera sp. WGK6]|uniref:beta strand repeat-containing protein n=1 Tax=Methanosphaera sp. WGK6 TaxID=1561964 RepID=UPI00084C5ADF|nr:hypothetical protein [Methanosphaera sp. WGK6]OED30415.1 hypothetical protein NL43_03370 [Methanosphaera sp. WGK6]
MNNKIYSVFLFILLVLICGLNSVSAEDANTTGIISVDTLDEGSHKIVNSDMGKIMQNTSFKEKQVNRTLKTDNVVVNSYDELVNEINNGSSDTIELVQGIYNGSNNINIDRNLTINGQDAVLTGNGTITIASTVIMGNLTFNQTGIIVESTGNLTLVNTTHSNNVGYAGAVYNLGYLAVNNSVFNENNASRGGAINNRGAMAIIENSMFTNNTAVYGGGGAIDNYLGYISINNNTISNSVATYGGAIYNLGNASISNNIITNCTGISGGGAIYNYENANVSVFNNIIANNSASSGGGICSYSRTSNFIINNIFINNTVSRRGGAIDNDGLVSIISGNTFINNNGSNGGAINNEYGARDTSIINNTFINNNGGYGGAINNEYGARDTSIINNTFINNNGSNGGAINNDYRADNTSVINNTFINNTAYNNGGVIQNDGTIIVNNNILNSNYMSNMSNGFVINNNGNISITNNLFINNTDNTRDMLLNNPTTNNTVFINNNTYIDNLLESTLITNQTYTIYSNNRNITVNMALRDVYNDTIRNGTITAYSNGNRIGMGNVVNGTANITLNLQNTGNVTLVYTTLNKNYQNTTIIIPVTVIKINSTITTNVINNTAGNVTVTVLVTDTETGTPINRGTVIIYDENGTTIGKESIFDNNTPIITTITEIGEYLINVTYEDNLDYYSSTTLININVTGRESTISTTVTNNTAGNVTLNINVVDTTTQNTITEGNIVIRDANGNILYNNNLNESSNVYLKDITTIGEYPIDVIFEGNTNHNSSNTNTSITVTGRDVTIDFNIQNNIIGNTTVNITLTDTTTGQTIPYAQIIITLPNGTSINRTTNENGTVITRLPIPLGNNNITITYNGNNIYNATKTTENILVNKVSTIIVVNPVTGVIGEKIILTAHVTDIKGNPLTGGNLVFKLNGKTLRIDGSFNSTQAPLKFSVVNGSVTYTLNADLYLRNAKNLSASYSGTSKYSENVSDITIAQIAKRNANITVTTVNTTKQDTNITFTAILTDTTRNRQNTTAINENGYVLFKLNGVSLKDNKGKIIRVKVENNTAQYTYHVPAGMTSTDESGKLKDYIVEAVYQNDIFYPDTRNTTIFNVEKSDITVNINNVLINNSTKRITSITGNITDYHGNLLIGNNRICVKVNGKTLKDNNNNTLYFTVTNGIINIRGITTNIKSFNNITIVTGETKSYKAGQNTTTKITIV